MAARDHSAYRVDSDVWGWNAAFTEMAAIASEVRRGKQGEQRGEQLILIFPVWSLIPKQSISAMVVTQPPLPDNPSVIEDIRQSSWIVGHEYQRLWPKRAIQKHFPGAMKIEPLWEAVPKGAGLCEPQVGFLLRYQGSVRFQAYQPLALQADCADLRFTDARIYWAKRDLGAVMIRFDYSPNDNEMSYRFPLAAGWSLARPLTIELVGAAPSSGAKKIRDGLAVYGAVRLRPGGHGAAWQIRHQPQLQLLANRLARALGLRLAKEPPKAGVDIEVSAAPVAAEPPASPKATGSDRPTCGGLLRDCD